MAFMRHNNNGRRHNNNRHRHNNSGQQQGQRRHVSRINHVFESNGPEGRVRGTAQQIVEKYLTMARDAHGAGDKVLSMNYYQHAEHYQRVLSEIQEENLVFEREREAQRAAQQASQPNITDDDAENGFADMATENNDDKKESSAPSRQPRQSASQQRAPRRAKSSEDDLTTLPGFLQVPISETAPPAASSDKNNTSSEVSVEKVKKPRAVRAPTTRTRRAAPVSDSAVAETDGTETAAE